MLKEFLELSKPGELARRCSRCVLPARLDDETIRCDLPWGDFPLIELINLILFLNGSDFEVEEIPKSRHPRSSWNTAACPQLTPCQTPPPLSSEAAQSSSPRAAIHGEVKAAGRC